MKHGSLESGIGGFDYAAEKMGWENVFHVEINSFCRTILKYYWPNANTYSDLFEFDGTKYRGAIDVLTCGFPCQPFSVSGKGKGDKDDRFIWPENMRIIREIQPPNVVAENVPGLLSKHPLVFERVCADLENEGYEVQPINIPACAAEKDHERQRWFFLAHNHRYGHRKYYGPGKDSGTKGADQSNENKRQRNQYEFRRNYTATANYNSEGLPFWIQSKLRKAGRKNEALKGSELSRTLTANRSWIEVAAILCSMDDGDAFGLDTKAVSKAKWYRESIKAYGNMVSWEIAYEIFKAIEAYDSQ